MKPTAKPPRDPDLSPLANAMRSRARPAKVVPFPGELGAEDGLEVALWNPTDEELAEAAAAATRYLRHELKLDEFQMSLAVESNLYRAEEERQILARVLRNPENHEESFATVEDLREVLTPDVRLILMRHLAAWIEERSPHVGPDGVEDPERLVALVRDLKGEGERALSNWLTACDFTTLVSIATSLADRCLKPTPPPSSDTSSSS